MTRFPISFIFKFALVAILALYHFGAHADNNGQQYALILSGGVDPQSNKLRYLENVRAMYSAAKSMNIDSSRIAVLYGSGNLKDTALSDQPQFSASASGYGYGTYPVPVQTGGFVGYPVVQPPNRIRQNQQVVDPSTGQLPTGQMQVLGKVAIQLIPLLPLRPWP